MTLCYDPLNSSFRGSFFFDEIIRLSSANFHRCYGRNRRKIPLIFLVLVPSHKGTDQAMTGTKLINGFNPDYSLDYLLRGKTAANTGT